MVPPWLSGNKAVSERFRFIITLLYSCNFFFFSREEGSANNSSSSPRRFYFEHIELRDVEVILTLLPAIDLPVDLQVIKNNLGIPHQLPPRFENACLYFGKYTVNDLFICIVSEH